MPEKEIKYFVSAKFGGKTIADDLFGKNDPVDAYNTYMRLKNQYPYGKITIRMDVSRIISPSELRKYAGKD